MAALLLVIARALLVQARLGHRSLIPAALLAGLAILSMLRALIDL